MLIPKGTGIKDFIDRYFVEDAMPDELLIDEQARIVYYEMRGQNSEAVPISLRSICTSTFMCRKRRSTMWTPTGCAAEIK